MVQLLFFAQGLLPPFQVMIFYVPQATLKIVADEVLQKLWIKSHYDIKKLTLIFGTQELPSIASGGFKFLSISPSQLKTVKKGKYS